MKRIFLIALFLLLFSAKAGAQLLMQMAKPPATSSYTFTYGSSAYTIATGDTVQLTGVTAGDTIVIAVKQGNYSGGLTSISDGTSTFTLTTTTRLDNINYCLQLGYLTSSVATGTVTYTCAPAGQAQRISIMRFTKTGGTVSIDTYSNPGASSSGQQTNAISPTINTTGSDLVIGVTSGNGAAASSPLIGGAAATGSVSSYVDYLFYKIYTTSQTSIAASVTNSADYWAAMILALKVQ